jgi:hypothetical protein
VKSYDPGLYILTWRGILFAQFSKGTFIKAGRTNPSAKLEEGAQGDPVRVLSRSRMGSIVATLQGTSPTNDLLSAQLALTEGGTRASLLLGKGPAMLKDLNGLTVASSPDAFLENYAEVEVGDEAPAREWTLLCPNFQIVVAGSIV